MSKVWVLFFKSVFFFWKGLIVFAWFCFSTFFMFFSTVFFFKGFFFNVFFNERKVFFSLKVFLPRDLSSRICSKFFFFSNFFSNVFFFLYKFFFFLESFFRGFFFRHFFLFFSSFFQRGFSKEGDCYLTDFFHFSKQWLKKNRIFFFEKGCCCSRMCSWIFLNMVLHQKTGFLCKKCFFKSFFQWDFFLPKGVFFFFSFFFSVFFFWNIFLF